MATAMAGLLTGPVFAAREEMLAVRAGGAIRRHLAGLAALRNGAPNAADLEGAPLVVNFFASWCPPCHPEAAILSELAVEWTPRGARFVSVNMFENFGGQPNPARLERFLERHVPPFPVIVADDATAKLFGGIDRIPTLFVFDGDGNPRYVFVHERGATKTHAGREEIEGALREILAA